MPWTDAPSAGFTSGKPWLPLAASHRAAAVSVQQDDAHSVLSAVRDFLAWRKEMPALREGSIAFYDTAEPVLMFRREHAGQVVLLAFNLSADPADLALPAGEWEQVDVPGVELGAMDGGHLRLAGHAVVAAVGRG